MQVKYFVMFFLCAPYIHYEIDASELVLSCRNYHIRFRVRVRIFRGRADGWVNWAIFDVKRRKFCNFSHHFLCFLRIECSRGSFGYVIPRSLRWHDFCRLPEVMLLRNNCPAHSKFSFSQLDSKSNLRKNLRRIEAE